MDPRAMSDTAVLSLIGERTRQTRLNQNRTQVSIAEAAGVGLVVIKRLEAGKGCTLSSFIRILRALGKIDQIDTLLPEPGVSPLEIVRREGKIRKEATGNRGRSRRKPD